MKCFIIMRDRLIWPKKLAEQCQNRNLEVFLIDNNSTYPPLIEWYKTCEHKIWFMGKNRTSWNELYNIITTSIQDRYFIITDPDLDIGLVPEDFIIKLMEGLYYGNKCGLSLEIDDLPKSDYTDRVIAHEQRFWQEKKGEFYKADTSTTFALYDREREFSLDAVRTPKPYTAKHLSWYLTEMDEEETYYQEHSEHTGWKPL